MPPEALILSLGCFVAAFCASVAGFAFVLVAAGILLHFIPPSVTAPILVLGSLLVQSLALPEVWRDVDWRLMRLYVASSTFGIPVGLLILAYGPAPAIVTFVGLLLVVYSGYMLARIIMRLAPPRIGGGRGIDIGIGFASGILGGIGGFVGALPAMWADMQGMDKRAARALMQPFIVAMQAIASIGLAIGGFFTRDALVLTATAVPAMLAGSFLGLRAYRALPAQGFRLALLLLLLVSGVSLVI
jgi:uncharacterized membrane protein YfcA